MTKWIHGKTYDDPFTNGAGSGLTTLADVVPDVGAVVFEPVGGFLLRRLLLSDRGPLFGRCG